MIIGAISINTKRHKRINKTQREGTDDVDAAATSTGFNSKKEEDINIVQLPWATSRVNNIQQQQQQLSSVAIEEQKNRTCRQQQQ